MRKANKVIYPRYADIIKAIEGYLDDIGKSARWLGIQIANDPRMMPKIIAGGTDMLDHVLAICIRMSDFYRKRLDEERAAERTQEAAFDGMKAQSRSTPITTRMLAGPSPYSSQPAYNRAAA